MAAEFANTKISKESAGGGVSALQVAPSIFDKKIEFHLARKPFNGFSNGAGTFRLETLNPSTSNPVSNSNTQLKQLDKSEVSENGLDPELSFGISFKRIGAGLANLGNTCFLNSVLQCLTYTEPLAAYLQSGKHKSSCRIAGFCALCAIQKHVNNALRSSGRILAPKEIVSNLRCISRNFRNARQEDAHEYMVNLLESMHKCCLPSGIPSESQSAYDKSSVHKIFGGRLRSQVKCMQCSYSSDKFDPFLDLSLEINKADSVHKALAHFTAKELLDGGERHYQCQQCKQKVKALKQLAIHKAPYVLTIHLKRFGSHIAGQKIDKRVQFGTTLDLKPFVTDPHDGDLKYTLYGVLVHAGWSTHSGHYYCFVRTSSGMWYSLDDYQVVQVSEKRVLEQKAYMLFYYRDRRNSSFKKSLDVVQKLNMNSIEKAKAYSNSSQGETFRCVQNGTRVDAMFSSATDAQSNLLNAAVPAMPIIKTAPCHNVPGLAAAECSAPITDSMSLHISTRGEGECLPQQDSCAKSSTLPLKADNLIVTEGNANVVECSGETIVKEHANSLIDLPSSSQTILKAIISNKTPSDPGTVLPDDNNYKSSQKVPDDSVAVSTLCCLSKESPPVTTETVKDSTGEDISCRPSDKINPVMRPTSSTLNNSQAMDPEVSTLPITKRISTQKNDHVEKSSPRVKKKIPKCPPMKMHFTSKISLRTFLNVRKKKHKRSKRCKLVSTNLDQKHLVNGDSIPADLWPSTSQEYLKTPCDGLYHSQRKGKKSGSKKKEKSLINSMASNCNPNLTAENKMESREKTGQNGLLLAANDQSRKCLTTASAGNGPDYSKDSKKEVQKVLTRGLEEAISVPRWDERKCNPIWKTEQSVPGKGNIGYVGDEWDEEYDRGKRKKVRNSERDFSGPNPFQEIATMKTKLKKARLGYSNSGNKPFRI